MEQCGVSPWPWGSSDIEDRRQEFSVGIQEWFGLTTDRSLYFRYFFKVRGRGWGAPLVTRLVSALPLPTNAPCTHVPGLLGEQMLSFHSLSRPVPLLALTELSFIFCAIVF